MNPALDDCPDGRQEMMDTQEDGGDEALPSPPATPTHRPADTDTEDDESRANATFRYVVQNFSKLKETVLSPATFVRNLPWKIMVMPRNQQMQGDRQSSRSLGFFLQCNGDSDSASWSCNAMAELRLISVKPGQENFSRKINHLFYSKENDWGFSHFMTWFDVLDPEKGYIQDDAVTLEVFVLADAPHGVSWDSKKHTGYVGLKNQGATCYMNSLLQVLYFTNTLRKDVYKMPTESDDSTKSVALALQRVFHELQTSDKPVGTKKLTKSFGWETLDSFMQHDAQEFLRVLLDKLETKMKGTCVEGGIPKLFEGKTLSYFKCKNVDYTSSRTETFYDIQLNIKGKKNIHESFKDYVSVESLEGDNKYDAGQHGLQDAEKGVVFQCLPPVLHLHLMRFQYDPLTDSNVKINDRFEFPEQLTLDSYMDENCRGGTYVLHAVLVHSGDNHGGHYVVFINPKGDGKWCKFDDDVVSRCTKKEAVDYNFGGAEDEMNLTVKHCTNAYMLVYIRKDEDMEVNLGNVLQEVTEEDIPQDLVERLKEEKHQELVRRKERSEAHLFMHVQVVLEESFAGHQGYDLFDSDKIHYRVFRIRKNATLYDFYNQLSQALNCPVTSLRLWPMAMRTNATSRVQHLDTDAHLRKEMAVVAENQGNWPVFVEQLAPHVAMRDHSLELPHFDKVSDVMLFFKYYDPRDKKIHYVGHHYMKISDCFSGLVPMLNERAGLPKDTELSMFEEVKPGLVDPMNELDKPIENAMEELMDGDIIIYQRSDLLNDDSLEFSSAVDYFRDVFNRTEVLFCDKTVPNDFGFPMEMSLRTSYDQMARLVGQRLNVAPYLLQFFRCQPHRDACGPAIRCNFDGMLKDMIIAMKPRQPKRIYYQQLSIRIDEMENKKQMKVSWLAGGEEQELLVFPNKSGSVGDLISEARKLLPDGATAKRPGVKLRLLEINAYRIKMVHTDSTPLEAIQAADTRSLRLEEVPAGEKELEGDELLVAVAHFHKEVYSTFGTPFLIKVKHGEAYSALRERLRARAEVTEKEWEKWRVTLVTASRFSLLPEAGHTDLQDFRAPQQPGVHKPYIGLEHVNKAQKRARYNYMEKSIKIYN